MTLPANIRINASAPFPAQVKGGGIVAVAKSNGVWTVSLLPFTNLGGVPVGTNPASTYLLVWNSVTQTFQNLTIAQLNALSTSNPTKITIANSPYPVQATDTLIYVDTAGGAIEIDLQAAALRAGVPLTIKDITGHAAANNITIRPVNGETIDGYTNAAPLLVQANYGGFRLNPYTLSYVIAP